MFAAGTAGCGFITSSPTTGIQVAGFYLQNETDGSQLFRIGITDSGDTNTYDFELEVDTNSKLTSERGTDVRDDFTVFAPVGESRVSSLAVDIVDAKERCVFPVLRLAPDGELSMSGRGFEDCPSEVPTGNSTNSS